MARFAILFLVTATSFAACSKDTAEGTSASSTSAPGEAVASAGEPTPNEISNYTLDMDKMTKWGNATKYLGEEAKKDPTLGPALKSSNDETTSQTIAKIEGNATARAAIQRAGLSPRDYVWISAAWLQAAMTEGIMSSTPGAKMPEGQNPKNVEFIKTHKKEIERLAKDAEMNQ